MQGTHSVCAEHSGGQCFQSWVDKRVNGLSVCLLPERSKTASIRCRWWAGWSWTALPGKQIHPSLICFTPPIWTFWKLLPRVQACKGNHLRWRIFFAGRIFLICQEITFILQKDPQTRDYHEAPQLIKRPLMVSNLKCGLNLERDDLRCKNKERKKWTHLSKHHDIEPDPEGFVQRSLLHSIHPGVVLCIPVMRERVTRLSGVPDGI